MPALKNPRHEKVAQLRAEGVNQTDAHERIYGKRSKAVAHRMCQRPDIIARVTEIQELRIQIEIDTTEHAMKKLGITKLWWLGNLKLNAEQCLLGQTKVDRQGNAHQVPDIQGFNKSMELIGRAMGVYIDKLEIGNPGDFARLTDAELRARVEADAQALGMEAEATEALLLTFQSKDEGEESQ